MMAKIIEGNNGFNWGKFAVLTFTADEWQYLSRVLGAPLLKARGWGRKHIWVLDLETGEGFCTLHGGLARADLRKHEIWVCPMFEPFLEWLYAQPIETILDGKLPDVVELDKKESAMRGYRRPGIQLAEVFSAELVKELKKLDIVAFRQLTFLTKKTFSVLVKGNKKFLTEVEDVFRKEGYDWLKINAGGVAQW